MSARSASGSSMRRSALLLMLAVLVYGAAAASCPDATALKQRNAGDTTGNFLSASMSWTHVKGNTVMFEMVSVWRRKHYWPCKAAVGFTGEDGWPGLGDMLTIVGLSSVQSKQARQESSGPVSTKLWTGESCQRFPFHPHIPQTSCFVCFSHPMLPHVLCCVDLSRRWKIPRAAAQGHVVFDQRGLGNGRVVPSI